MSKKLKKLVGILLCLTMSVTALGMTVFADGEDVTATAAAVTDKADIADDTADDTAEEATEELAEETVEEVSEPVDKYADDDYYAKALELCSTLGIITGYEDGSVKPESTVTRAEMSAIVLRMLNHTSTEKYAAIFNDVKSDHWAADTIQTVASLGIVNGMGDGSFKPDGEVKYDQVTKMIICALGYEVDALISGPYPSGYLNMAKSLDLDECASGAAGINAERGTVIKMVYNALLTDIKEIVGTDPNGGFLYDTTDTLAKKKFNVIDEEGILTATPKSSISSSSKELLDNQIVIDGEIYETELKGLEDLLGSVIVFYYTESKDSTKKVIAVSSASTDTETIELDLENIESMEGFETGDGKITMYKGGGSVKKCPGVQIVYNGEMVTLADFNSAKAAEPSRFMVRDYEGTSTGEEMDFNDFLCPEVGTVKLVDTDGDGYYDIMFVDSYETMVVTSITTKKLAGRINNELVSFNVNTEADDELEIYVSKAGTDAKVKNLKKDDVVSVKRSLDNKTFYFNTTGESIIGEIASTAIENDALYVVIAGEKYEVDANAVEDAKIGSNSTMYLDMFGRIGRIESSTSGTLSASEKYGWVMAAYMSDDATDYVVKMYTQDGKVEEYKLANKVKYWGAKDTSATSLAGDARARVLQITDGYDNVLRVINDDTNQEYVVRLAKFKANSSKEITQLYMAVDASVVEDEEALRFHAKNLRSTSSVGQSIAGYKLQDNMVGFTVPTAVADMKSGTDYSTYSANASSYLSSDGGVKRDFVIGEFDDDNTANVVVTYTTGETVAVDAGDYNTAGDNSCMVVTSIGTGIDEEDEPIYIINGIRGGQKLSYTTGTTTTLAKVSASGIFKDTRTYSTSNLWSAKDENNDLRDYLREGDVIGVQTGNAGEASIILKMVDVKELAKIASLGSGNQYIGYDKKSDSRDGIGIGEMASNPDDDGYFMYATDRTWYFGSSVSIDVVEVTTDSNGFVDAEANQEVFEVSELSQFDAENVWGDYIFFRNFKNDGQREAIVFRFND